MKPTPFLKRVFASLVTVATLSTLASTSLYQQALAADIAITVDKSGSDNAVTAVSLPESGDYSADANIVVTWDNVDNETYFNGYANGALNTGALGTLSGSISMTDTTVDADKLNRLYLYALNNASGASISTISAATISASNTVDLSSRGFAYGIYNDGTITEIKDNSSISATSLDRAYGIYNNNTLGDISNSTITATATDSFAYGICNWGNSASIAELNQVSIEASSTYDWAYGIMLYDGASTPTSMSGSISASTGSNTATTAALYAYDMNATWNFGGDTALIAQGGKNNYAIWGCKDVGESSNVTLTSLRADGSAAGATVTMTGDIKAGGKLSLESGNYVLAGDSTTITATTMNINSGASLTLKGDTTFAITDNTLTLDVSTVDFSLASIDDYTSNALLIIADTASMDGISTINIVLNDAFTESDAEFTDAVLASIIDDSKNVLSGSSVSYNYSYVDAEFETIPEPSTATLSLLALAGLCARRRRKAA